MPTCPSCHRDQDRPSAFCVYCGALLDRPATAPAPPSSTTAAEVQSPASRRAAARADLPGADLGGAYVLRRLLALLVDVALVGGLIAIAIDAWLRQLALAGTVPAVPHALLWYSIIAWCVVRWLFEGIAASTPGKLVFGLVVARTGTNGRAGLGRAFVRTLFLPIDLCAIGFIVAAFGRRRRRIGDLFAGTRVVNARIRLIAPLLGLAIIAAGGIAVDAETGSPNASAALARDIGLAAFSAISTWATRGNSSPSTNVTPAPSASPAPGASPSPRPTPASAPSLGNGPTT